MKNGYIGRSSFRVESAKWLQMEQVLMTSVIQTFHGCARCRLSTASSPVRGTALIDIFVVVSDPTTVMVVN